MSPAEGYLQVVDEALPARALPPRDRQGPREDASIPCLHVGILRMIFVERDVLLTKMEHRQ